MALLGVAAALGGAVLAAGSITVGAQHRDRPRVFGSSEPPPLISIPIAGTGRASRPVRIEIPAIGVRARVIALGLNPDRTLQVPRNFADAGWWAGGTRPGGAGPAVVVGHVDSLTGPAVFYRLARLQGGDRIRILRADNSTVHFTVRRLAKYSKDRFPARWVYRPTRRATLRLVTCSGAFDRSTGHYLDNTVVYAAMAVRR